MAKKIEKKFNAAKEKYDDELKRMADNYETNVGALQSLSSNDIAALKSIKNPAKSLRLVAEAVALVKASIDPQVLAKLE